MDPSVRQGAEQLLDGQDLFETFHRRELRTGRATRTVGSADQVSVEEGRFARKELAHRFFEGGDRSGDGDRYTACGRSGAQEREDVRRVARGVSNNFGELWG